jgi:DNA-binding transcriptional LysR family regulator
VTAEARHVMQSLETIGKLAQQARGLNRGRVRIAGFRSVATHILPEVIQQFRNCYPGIQVKIEEYHHFRQVENEVRHGQADIGFTYLPTSHEFEVWELMRDRYVLLLPPNETSPKYAFDWETLAQLPMILAPPGDGCRDLISRYFKAAGYSVEPAYEVREDSTILSMVQQGLGATIMANLAAEPIPPTLRVAELPVPMERCIGVIQLADALQPPPVFAFMEALKKVWAGVDREVKVG